MTVPEVQTGPGPWRYRCPEGHASLEGRKGEGYYCLTCQKRYREKPTDLKYDS